MLITETFNDVTSGFSGSQFSSVILFLSNLTWLDRFTEGHCCEFAS